MSNAAGAEVPRFRIAICTELAPRPAFLAAGGHEPRRPLRVDKVALAPLFASIAPSISLEVADPFAAAESVRVEVTFRETKGLKPDILAEHQAELRALTETHRLLRELREGRSSAAHLAERLPGLLTRPAWSKAVLDALSGKSAAPAASVTRAPASAAAAAPPPAEGSLSRLLDQVDLASPADASGTPASPGVPRVSSIIAAVARGSSAPRPGAEPRQALELVEGAYRALLAGILAHPELRRLASAWLGLRWFVDRCDFRSGVELEVACVPREDVLRTLEAWAERDEDSEEPAIDLCLVDHGVGPEDVALLASWAAVAAQARSPLVVTLEPKALTVDTLRGLDEAVRRAAEPVDVVDERLRTFARTDDARWVVASANGAQARSPHVPTRGAEIPYEESADAAGADLVSPSLLVGALCAGSHTRRGWATDLHGVPGGVIEDLPLSFIVDDGEDLTIPLHALVREAAARALGRQGIAVSSCVANRDQAMFFRVPTLHREATDEGERSTTTLGDQLFTRRLANALDLVASAVPASSELRAIEETAAIVLSDLFGNDRAKPELRIGVTGEPKAGERLLTLSCTPRGFQGVSLRRVDLAARLGS